MDLWREGWEWREEKEVGFFQSIFQNIFSKGECCTGETIWQLTVSIILELPRKDLKFRIHELEKSLHLEECLMRVSEQPS